MDLHQWISDVTGDESAQNISRQSGVPLRTVQNSLSTGRMGLENKLLISTAYGRHPLRTLVEWGVIDSAWESVPDIEAALRIAGEEQLAREVLRRMKLGAKTNVFDLPVDKLQRDFNQKSVSDRDALIARINSGEEPVAAQEATDPLEENQP